MNHFAYQLGITAATFWIMYTICEVAYTLYTHWNVRRLRKLEEDFIKRWYANKIGERS